MGNRKLLLPEPYIFYLNKKKKDWTLGTYNQTKGHLRNFIDYLEMNNINLKNLTHQDLINFAIYLKKIRPQSHIARMSGRKKVQSCLVFLSKNKIIKRDYRDWYPNYKHWPHFNDHWPQVAQDYLDLMYAIRNPSTKASTKANIARFHQFVKRNKITLKHLNRRHVEIFFKAIHKTNITKDTMRKIGLDLRRYFYWLHYQKKIARPPELLIKKTDIPPRTKKLPRPLNPSMDNQLLNIFKGGNDIFFDALILMRNTGLRIGEIINLEFDCVKEDFKGNKLLKVPLGKLNTERLVPLTVEMDDLIKKIQKKSKINSKEKSPEKLIISALGKKATYWNFKSRMDEIQAELPYGKTVCTHQLRHTCATSLLNNGMNIVALKEFLGHKDIHMTLRYASVAPLTIITEYNKAIKNIQNNYELNKEKNNIESKNSIEEQILDLIRIIKKKSNSKNKTKEIKAIRTLKRVALQIK